MVDFLISQHGNALFVNVLWQSGLFLIVGLVASLALRRRPARAHRVLLLAILGAMVTPLGSHLVRRERWGLWRTTVNISGGSANHLEPGLQPRNPAVPAEVLASGEFRSGSQDRLKPGLQPREWSDLDANGLIERTTTLSESSDSPTATAIALRSILLGIWGIFSGICLARLIVSMMMGRRVVSRARPIADGSLVNDAAVASTHLGLLVRPDLLASDRAACPAIWCWGRRPVILLPEPAGPSPVDWIGVFCHELAHWVRRDHLSGLVAEILTVVLPWHPLTWWARHRLAQLSELACDDWALSTGLEAADYAETLLGLSPQRRGALALSAVTSRHGLIGRVRHILDERRINPVVGTGWTILSAATMVLASSVLALAQAREGSFPPDETEMTRAQPPQAAPRADPGDPVRRRVIKGTVREASGKPVAGASIFVVGHHEHRERTNGWYFTHGADESHILGQVAADSEGRFVLDLALDPAVLNVDVITRAAGMGLAGRNFSARPQPNGQMFYEPLDDRPIELTLRPNLPIEGRLLSQSGTPASGVSVALTALELGDRPDEGFFLGAPEDDEGRPIRAPYWPEPVVTDPQGRFRIDGSSEKAVARVALAHVQYIDETIIISTESELGGYRKAWRLKATPPRFTHVLGSARPIEGIVTDKASGQPLAGVHVEIGSMNGGPTLPNALTATTDAQGRYRVTGVAWDDPNGLFVQLIPDAESGYLPSQQNRKGWPAGATELRWDLTNSKGSLVRGRVIDAGTKQPIPGAQVTGDIVAQKAISDEDGRFSLWIDPEYRSLFVEGPTPDYQRLTVPRSEVKGEDAFYHPHGYARINVNPDGTIAPVEIALKKGATIAAQAVDPDGQPLRDVWASGESAFVWSTYPGAGSGHCSLGSYRSASFEAGRTHRLFFIQNERHLAGFADLAARFEPAEPVGVTLRETARVRGKLLRPDGTPDRQKGVSVYFLLTREEVKLHPMEFLRGARLMDYGRAARRGGLWLTKTNDEGEFKVDDLVAGVRHYIAFDPLSSAEVQYIPVEPLRPGEVRDLGKVKPIVLTDRNP
jgi:beta-lactamase regulating signal transducer with metallopeptidase domain